MIGNNIAILINNRHYDTVPAADLIDKLVEMLQTKAYAPMRDIIEILSEEEWMKRKPVPRARH